jgi:nucleotide-binding universal stress UspA family protein
MDWSTDDLRSLIEARRERAPRTACRLLLPFDGSRAALNAVHYVADSVKDGVAEVQLLNVQRPVLDDPALMHAAHGIIEAHRSAGERVLRAAREILDAEGVAHSAQVAFGPAAETIARVAAENRCSLIVMGTRGRHPMVNLVTGSVPSRVVQHARVPVMLIRRETQARLHLPSRRQHASPFIAA